MKTYFKYMFDFEKLEELNLSCNWYGTEGLYEVRQSLSKFTNLKVLRLGTNKLCLEDPKQTVLAMKLCSVLKSLKPNMIEVLDLQENSINDDRFKVIIPAIVQ